MLKWSLPLQRARQNNQNEHIICLIWSSYKAPIKNSPVQLKPSVHRFHKKQPVQPVFTGPIAWTVREANRTAIVSGSVFYWSNCRSDPVLITMLMRLYMQHHCHLEKNISSFFSLNIFSPRNIPENNLGPA